METLQREYLRALVNDIEVIFRKIYSGTFETFEKQENRVDVI